MRTTIDLPDHLFKAVKMKALDQGLTLKQFFTKALQEQLHTSGSRANKPWKALKSQGSADALHPSTSGFEGYTFPDLQSSYRLNESKD